MEFTESPVALGAEIANVIMLGAVIIGAAWKSRQRLEKREKELDVRMAHHEDSLATLSQTIEKQFSGNSGGIREAVNGIARKQDAQDEKLDRVAEDVATLRGRFEQSQQARPRSGR